VTEKVSIAVRPHGLKYNGLFSSLELLLFRPSLYSLPPFTILCHVNKKWREENYKTSYLKWPRGLRRATLAVDKTTDDGKIEVRISVGCIEGDFSEMISHENVGFTDMQTVFLACIATLIPLVFILLAGFIVRPQRGPHSNLGTEIEREKEDVDDPVRSWTITGSLRPIYLRAVQTEPVQPDRFLWRKFHVRKGEGYEGVLQREESSDPLAVKSLSVSGNILPHERKQCFLSFISSVSQETRFACLGVFTNIVGNKQSDSSVRTKHNSRLFFSFVLVCNVAGS
ncbi:unnamed protein product, partial [Timema podura]|nr:unnamed protein product [Timema podura]